MSKSDIAAENKLQEINKRMAEFIATSEVALNTMNAWKEEVEQTIKSNQEYINQQLTEIRTTTDELKKYATEVGAARLRVATQQALKEGREHVETLGQIGREQISSLQASNETLMQIAKKSFERLDRATHYAVKQISSSVKAFDPSDIKQLVAKSCETVELTSSKAIDRLKDLVNWFHWKNLALAGVITIIVAITTGLYLNDELPWESHQQAVMQRNAGQALINAWPKLTQLEKERILEHAKKTIT